MKNPGSQAPGEVCPARRKENGPKWTTEGNQGVAQKRLTWQSGSSVNQLVLKYPDTGSGGIGGRAMKPTAAPDRITASASDQTTGGAFGGKAVGETGALKRAKALVDGMKLIGAAGADQNPDGFAGEFDNESIAHADVS